MHISSILDKAKRLWPGKEAVVCGRDRYNYEQFFNRVQNLANFYLISGLTPGDRVAIILHNCHRYLEAYFAAAYAGLILTPINFRLSKDELGYILKDSGARLLISHGDYKQKVIDSLVKFQDSLVLKNIIWSGVDGVEEIKIDGYFSLEYETALEQAEECDLPVTPGDDEPAHLYYTSGTTGKPKGVVLTHTNVITHAIGAVSEFQLIDSDVWGHIAPLYHLADAWATFAITLVGGKHVLVPKFEPGLVLKIIRKEGVTLSNLIPTMLNQLVNSTSAAKVNYPSLRFILSGGAPIAPELVRQVINTFGCEYVQTYGMTETSPYLTVSLLKEYLRDLPAEERFKYQSRTGREFITVELKVVREDGSEVERDDSEVGEIWVRGPSISSGYWNNPEETAAAFQDGWLKTGDLAVIDSEGYVNIVDRKKDMILTGGENVYSTEVEHILYEHPAVLEAAVIGVPDEQWGEAVKGLVVLKPGLTVSEEELIQLCKARLAHYKAPKSVDFVGELPKTGTGKIYKKALKDKYWAGYEKRVH
ncbi:long-chain-fatty-acid--CoA ligase [[Eubacterium] cellulosolvens]